jgi:hypothetical protein
VKTSNPPIAILEDLRSEVKAALHSQEPTLLSVYLSGHGGNGLQIGWSAPGDKRNAVLSTKVLFEKVVASVKESPCNWEHLVIVYADYCRLLGEQVGCS